MTKLSAGAWTVTAVARWCVVELVIRMHPRCESAQTNRTAMGRISWVKTAPAVKDKEQREEVIHARVVVLVAYDSLAISQCSKPIELTPSKPHLPPFPPKYPSSSSPLRHGLSLHGP